MIYHIIKKFSGDDDFVIFIWFVNSSRWENTFELCVKVDEYNKVSLKNYETYPDQYDEPPQQLIDDEPSMSY